MNETTAKPVEEIGNISELFESGEIEPGGEFEKLGDVDGENEPGNIPTPETPPAQAATAKPEGKIEVQFAPEQGAATVTASDLIDGNLPEQPLPPPPERKGPGRPPGVKNKPKDTTSNIVLPDPTSVNAETEKIAMEPRQLAGLTFDLTTNSLSILLGPEWQAKTPKERDGMVSAIEIYLRTKNVQDIPPGAILCFAIAAYSAPRMREPMTSGKLKTAYLWCKNWWLERKQKRLMAKAAKS